MALTAQEVDSVRFHMGYGNLDVAGTPYTDDGFLALFEQLVSQQLSTANETSSSTQVTVTSSDGVDQTVLVDSMTGITVGTQLVVDVGDQAELVTVRSVQSNGFSARFTKSHPQTGYPIGTLRGVTRLRMLLWQAEKSWQGITSSDVSDSAGLKSIDKGDVVWFEGFRVLRDRLDHYLNIVCMLERLLYPIKSQRGCAGGGVGSSGVALSVY